MRRIVYAIGDGLLVIALFTAALSAQKAVTVASARATVAAPPNVQSEGSMSTLPVWPNWQEQNTRAFAEVPT